jgi:hypothetical protein
MVAKLRVMCVAIAVGGVIGFGALMALRSQLTGLGLRSVVAGIAFCVVAMALHWCSCIGRR